MYELHLGARVRKRREWEKDKPAPKYTRVWLVTVIIVCKRTAHSWSVLCPSFFPLLRCPRIVFTHTLPPISSALLFAFLFFSYSHAFVHLFSPSFLSLFSSRAYMRALDRLVFFAMRPYSRTRRREKSVILVVFREYKETTEKGRSHACIITFRS